MTIENKIKVLHIITRLDPGGSSTNTVETVARLDKNKYEAYLFFGRTHDPQGKIVDSLKKRGIRFKIMGDLVREINPWRDIKTFFALRQEIKNGSYGIVHTHSSKAGILGRWAAKCAGVKYIVHTPHGHVFYGYFNPIVTRIFIVIEQLTALITQRIITLTQRGKEEHIHFKIAPADKFVPIYSGIDLKIFERSMCNALEKKRNFNIPTDVLVYGTIARLEPIKGINYLVEAMSLVVSKFPKSRLLIVGEGKEHERLKEQVRSLRLTDNVILTGHREDVPELLQIMDIFILPSLNEGMGRVILEAMAFGKPVVATRVGGIPELVLDGKTGVLVPPSSSQHLAEAMIKLSENPSWAKELGMEGRNTVHETFGLDKMVKKIEQLYDGLMAAKI